MSWRAELLAAWAVVVRNALMGVRNVFFFFELLFWPVVGVLSIGLMTRFLGLTPQQGAFVLVGTIALSVINVCQLEVAYAMLLDVWSKSVKHQFMAPIGVRPPHARRLAGRHACAASSSSCCWRDRAPGRSASTCSAAGPGAGRRCSCWAASSPRWVVGVLVCALITLFGTRAEAFAWASRQLGRSCWPGIYYPVSVLPGWVAAVSAWIPLTYFLDGFRAGYGFPSEFAHPFLKGFALVLGYVALAHGALAAAITRARRTGLLLKLSE